MRESGDCWERESGSVRERDCCVHQRERRENLIMMCDTVHERVLHFGLHKLIDAFCSLFISHFSSKGEIC